MSSAVLTSFRKAREQHNRGGDQSYEDDQRPPWRSPWVPARRRLVDPPFLPAPRHDLRAPVATIPVRFYRTRGGRSSSRSAPWPPRRGRRRRGTRRPGGWSPSRLICCARTRRGGAQEFRWVPVAGGRAVARRRLAPVAAGRGRPVERHAAGREFCLLEAGSLEVVLRHTPRVAWDGRPSSSGKISRRARTACQLDWPA